MTNREAIENLKGCVVSYEVDEHGNPNGNVTADLTMEIINMAISALEKQEQDGWIPITERMPEENDFVLVTVSGEDVRGCEWKDSMALAVWTNQWNLVDANLVSYSISAWRPLPEPYTEEES